MNTILAAIESFVAGKISSAPYDVTRQGIVTDVNGDTYTVQIGGRVYSIVSGQAFAKGDIVYVLFVQNDPKNKFILGKKQM